MNKNDKIQLQNLIKENPEAEEWLYDLFHYKEHIQIIECKDGVSRIVEIDNKIRLAQKGLADCMLGVDITKDTEEEKEKKEHEPEPQQQETKSGKLNLFGFKKY